MNIEYEWTRDDLKRKLNKKRKVPNVLFIVLGSLFYLYITYYGFVLDEFDTKYLILGFFIYTTCLGIILFIVTKIYVFSRLRRNDKKTAKAYGTYKIVLSDKSITSSINSEKISYKWEDINKFKKKKNYFFIATNKDKIGLLFCKDMIDDKEYNKLLEYVKNKLK